MALNKREEEFYKNHERYKNVQKHFKFAFWAGMLPSAAVWVALTLVYAIRGLAMLAGAELVLVQKILNDEMGTNESSGLPFKTPYAYLTFLFVIALLTFITFFFNKKKPHLILFLLYAGGAVFGLIGMFTGAVKTLFGLYLLAYGCYGMWLEDFVRRLHKELDYLSLQDGYPDFMQVINEPKSMSNTSGLTRRRSEYRKRLRQDGGEIEKPLPILTEQETSSEMEELSIDSPPPKGSRKIDNMM